MALKGLKNIVILLWLIFIIRALNYKNKMQLDWKINGHFFAVVVVQFIHSRCAHSKIMHLNQLLMSG